MGILKKLIHCLSTIVYILIIIYVVVWLPNLFGYKPLVILSGSMEPTYDVGTIIYTKKVDKEEIKKNDIITFISENKYVSHRVNDITDNGYVTKGDANNVDDILTVKYEDIVGKNANITIKYIGYYIKFACEHLYLLIIAIIILALDFLLANTDNSKINMSEGKEKQENEE